MIGNPWRMYLSVVAGVTGIRRYGGAIFANHGVSKRDQFLRVSIDYYRNGTPVEDFYLYQFYLRERWKSRVRHFPLRDAADAPCSLAAASPDFELLWNKDKFVATCEERKLSTIPVIASFLDGSPQGASADLPSADLFSKPTVSNSGSGAQSWLYDPSSDRFASRGSTELTKRDIVTALCEQSKLRKIVVQRTARNHRDMASLTNGALATIRIVTCRAPSGAFDMLPPVIRMPCGRSVVDNFNNGGIVAPLDRDDGILTGPAIQRDTATAVKTLTVHPDTGVPLQGFAVPRWPEVVELALRAHKAFPTLVFVCWDIAVLPSGPALLEGNPIWAPDEVLLPHGIALSDTQFVRYFNYHVDHTVLAEPTALGIVRDIRS